MDANMEWRTSRRFPEILHSVDTHNRYDIGRIVYLCDLGFQSEKPAQHARHSPHLLHHVLFDEFCDNGSLLGSIA